MDSRRRIASENVIYKTEQDTEKEKERIYEKIKTKLSDAVE